MSGPKSIDISNTSFTVQNFRDMVNYENTTNRGYVRSAMGKDGKVVLEKVSKHWYSLPFHDMRSRVDAVSNQQMRERFVEALRDDLKYAGCGEKTFKEIENRVIYQPDAQTKRTESLSRKEVESILHDFDLQFNSRCGRRTILKNLIEHLWIDSKSRYADIDTFKREALKIDPNDNEYSGMLTLCGALDEKGDPVKEFGHEKMQHGEVEFRGYLQLLEQRASESKLIFETQVEISKNVRDLLRMQGDEIVVEERMKNSLHGLLERACSENIELLSQPPPKGAGADLAKSFVKAFVDKVLPVALRCAKDDLKALGIDADRNPDEFNAYIEEYVSTKGIVEKANEFLAQAVIGFADRQKWTRQLQENFGGGREISDSLKVVFKAGNTKAFTQNVAWSNVKGVDRRQYAMQLLGLMDQAFDMTKDDVVLDLFLKSFLVANYGDDPAEKVNEVGCFTERLKGVRYDVETALKVNFGERYVVDGRKTDTMSMGEIVKDLSSDGIKVMKENGVSDWTINQLLTRSLPKIINQNICRNRESAQSMYRGQNGASAIIERLVSTGKVIDRFWNEKLEREFTTTYRRLDKFIRSMASRHGWPAEDLLKEIKGSFRKEFMEMAETAIAEFLDDAVHGVDQAEEAAKALVEKFDSCRAELVGKVNQRLRAYAVTRIVGLGKTDRVIVRSTAMEILNEYNSQIKDEGRLNDDELAQLAGGPLLRKWDETVFAVLSKDVKKSRVDLKWSSKVKSEFGVSVRDVLNKVADYKRHVQRRLAETCGKFVDYAFSNPDLGFNKYLQLKLPGTEQLDQGRIAEVRRRAVEHLIMMNTGTASELVERFIRNPDADSSKTAIDRRLQADLDVNGRGDLMYNLLVFYDKHAAAVEEQLKKVCFGDLVEPDMMGRVIGAVDERSPFKTKFDKSYDERQLVLAMAFGNGNIGVVDDVKKHPFAYSDSTERFQSEVAGRAAKLLEQAAAEYDRRREEMLTAFAPIADGYSGLTAEQKREVLDLVLGNIAATNRERLLKRQQGGGEAAEPISLEEAKRYFDRQLFNRLNDIADQKFSEYQRVATQITKVYDAVMPSVKQVFSFEDLRTRFSAAVPDEVVARFSEKMLKNYVEHVNYRLTLEVSKDPTTDPGKYAEKINEETDELIKRVIADVNAWAVDQTKDRFAKVSVIDLVDQSGDYAGETAKTEVYELLCDNLKTWGAAPSTTERTTEIMKLVVDESWAKYVAAGEGYVESEKLTSLKAELLKELDEAAAKIIKSLFVAKFDKQNVAATLALVDRFVREGWQFGENSQVPNMIRKVVIQRIHDLETKETINDDTVILDVDIKGNGTGTMDRINDIVNGQGSMDKVINERGNKQLEMHTAFIRSANPELFDLKREGITQLEKEAVTVNTEVLDRFVHNVICNQADIYIAENGKIHDAMIDLPKFDRMVAEAIDGKKDIVLAACKARVQSAREIPGIVARKTAECIAALSAMINAKRPEGKKIAIEPDWTVTNIQVLGDDMLAKRLLLFVGYIRAEFDKRMQLLGGEAFANREFGERLDARFGNSVKDFLVHVGDSSAPATMSELGVETKKGFFYDKSWFNVFLDSLKTK